MQQRLYLVTTLLLLGACASTKNSGSVKLSEGKNPFRDESQANPSEWAESQKLSYFRLIFAGNVNGQLEPCGCSVNPKGGLDRRLNFILQQKADPKVKNKLLIVDAGNSLFPAKTLDKGQAPLQKKRALAILKGHARMGVMVQNVGALEFAAGWEFLQKAAQDAAIPFVSSNLKNAQGQNLFPGSHKAEVGGLRVAVLGVTAGSEQLPDGITVSDPFESLEKEMAQYSAATPLVILSDLGQVKDRELAQRLSRPAIIVGGRDMNSLELPYHEKNSVVVQTQLQGQQWGVMNVAWNADGQSFYNRKVAQAFSQRWNDMETTLDNLGKEGGAEARAEKARVNQAATEMLAYAPGNLQQKIVYDYRLNDMTIEYAKANELSPLVRELKQKK